MIIDKIKYSTCFTRFYCVTFMTFMKSKIGENSQTLSQNFNFGMIALSSKIKSTNKTQITTVN